MREKHLSAVSCLSPNQGWNLQPRHVPWPGIQPATFQCTRWWPNQLSQPTRNSLTVYIENWINLTSKNIIYINISSFCFSYKWFPQHDHFQILPKIILSFLTRVFSSRLLLVDIIFKNEDQEIRPVLWVIEPAEARQINQTIWDCDCQTGCSGTLTRCLEREKEPKIGGWGQTDF